MKQNKSTRTRRFTVLDALIILVILAVIGVGIYFFVGKDEVLDTNQSSVPIAYTIEIRGIEDVYVGNISVGDTVVDSVTKKTIGTVTAVENLPHTQYVINQTNAVVEEKEFPGQSNLLLTVSSNATWGELGYEIEGYRVAIGILHYLQLPNFVGSGYCISVQEQT